MSRVVLARTASNVWPTVAVSPSVTGCRAARVASCASNPARVVCAWLMLRAWLVRAALCPLGSFEAGDVPGDRGEFDVALIAGRQRGDLGELLGGGFGAVVAQVTGQGVGV